MKTKQTFMVQTRELENGQVLHLRFELGEEIELTGLRGTVKNQKLSSTG